MKHLHAVIAGLLVISIPLLAIAAPPPHRISNLSDDALLGTLTSTTALQTQFDRKSALIAMAGVRLGLTASDVAEVRADIASGLARYVELPRRLDGMAGERNGVAFSVRNVIIPAHTHGWEVDLIRSDSTVKVYIPNQCGNISFVRVPRPQVTALVVTAQRTTPPPEIVAAPTPAPLPEPTSSPVTLTPQAERVPHLAWLGALLVPLLFIHGGGGGGGSTIPVHTTPAKTPIPIHTICPPSLAPYR